MATITITTTNLQDVAATRYAAEFNLEQRSLHSDWVDVTPLQWFKLFLNNKLDSLVAYYKDLDTTTKIEAYAKASDADKATIDNILAKYQ